MIDPSRSTPICTFAKQGNASSFVESQSRPFRRRRSWLLSLLLAEVADQIDPAFGERLALGVLKFGTQRLADQA
jgi:hypothetical protein